MDQIRAPFWVQAMKSEDGKTRDGSRFFLGKLLVSQGLPVEGAAKVAAAAPGRSAALPSLAADVLLPQLDTQLWLRATAAAFRAGAPRGRLFCTGPVPG